MSRERALAELQHWRDAKRLYRLTNAHVQMARELGVKPDHLLAVFHVSTESGVRLLGQRIQELYQRHFDKARPDRVCSIRQLEREERARERLIREAQHEHRREDDEAWRVQVEATRASLLTVKRLMTGSREPVCPRIRDDKRYQADCRHQLTIGAKKSKSSA
jgi:tRNA U34 5-carboxymethylaminomethyl modifying GTPase MnmE/TrmE